VILLPKEAILFIRQFDLSTPLQRVAMNTIQFEIDVPDDLINQIGINEVYKILSESKTLEHVNI